MTLKKKRYQAIQEHLSSHGTAPDPLLSEEPKKYDPTATTDDLLADLRRVQEEHPDSYISRRTYRKFGLYSDSTWDSKFGTFHEFRRQARLELSRGQHNLERQIAKHASLDVYRGFAEEEILPWAVANTTSQAMSAIRPWWWHPISTTRTRILLLLRSS